MRPARGGCDVPAGTHGRAGSRRRGVGRPGSDLPVPEAGGPRAARRVAARSPAARHRGSRHGDQRVRRLHVRPGADPRPGDPRRPTRRPRPHLRARAPCAAARRGRSHRIGDRGAGACAGRGAVAHPLMNVGVVGNPSYRDLKNILAHLAQVAPRVGVTLYTEEEIGQLWPEPAPPSLRRAPQLDCLITLGGDGPLLRGARTLNGASTPILGVNLGRGGFLTTATSQTLDWALDALVRRAYATESRLALAPFIEDKQGRSRAEPIVLNDAVVHKGGVARVIRLRVSVDGDELVQSSSDGIVVATPTGSTAYPLSAGGPIVVPSVDAIVVAAICPHTLAVRPLVVPPHAAIAVEPIPPWTEEVLVSFDGQGGTTMSTGERLVVKRAAHPVLLVRLGPEGFFARMRKKLQWGDLSDRERK